MSPDAISNIGANVAGAPFLAKQTAAQLSERAISLADVTWDEYIALRSKPANSRLRMTFDNGVLEITTLSRFHELISMMIHDFILEWRVAKNIAVLPTGSMTLRRQSADRGLEGDHSYYIEHESLVCGLSNRRALRLPDSR